MKKTLILIIIFVIVAISCIFTKYTEYSKYKTEIQNINNEFMQYQNGVVQINTIISLMNRAIELNKKNNITQEEDLNFIENDTNSIKIYLETTSSDGTELVQIPMEKLMLSERAGAETVMYAFSDLKFTMKEKAFHPKTGQIKKIIFSEK